MCWVPGANDRGSGLFLGGELEVEVEELFEEVVCFAEAVGLEGELVEFLVKFGELAGGFVEKLVIEFCDAVLMFFHHLAAIVVEVDRGLADFLDDFCGWGWGKWEGFKTSVMGVRNICFER